MSLNKIIYQNNDQVRTAALSLKSNVYRESDKEDKVDNTVFFYDQLI